MRIGNLPIKRIAYPVAVVAILAIALAWLAPTPPTGAQSTATVQFDPASISLDVGQTRTVTIGVSGLPLSADTVQFLISESGADFTISGASCIGVFSSGFLLGPNDVSGDTSVACSQIGGASGSDGDAISFDLTRNTAGSGTLGLGLEVGGPFGTSYFEGGSQVEFASRGGLSIDGPSDAHLFFDPDALSIPLGQTRSTTVRVAGLPNGTDTVQVLLRQTSTAGGTFTYSNFACAGLFDPGVLLGPSDVNGDTSVACSKIGGVDGSDGAVMTFDVTRDAAGEGMVEPVEGGAFGTSYFVSGTQSNFDTLGKLNLPWSITQLPALVFDPDTLSIPTGQTRSTTVRVTDLPNGTDTVQVLLRQTSTAGGTFTYSNFACAGLFDPGVLLGPSDVSGDTSVACSKIGGVDGSDGAVMTFDVTRDTAGEGMVEPVEGGAFGTSYFVSGTQSNFDTLGKLDLPWPVDEFPVLSFDPGEVDVPALGSVSVDLHVEKLPVGTEAYQVGLMFDRSALGLTDVTCEGPFSSGIPVPPVVLPGDAGEFFGCAITTPTSAEFTGVIGRITLTSLLEEDGTYLVKFLSLTADPLRGSQYTTDGFGSPFARLGPPLQVNVLVGVDVGGTVSLQGVTGPAIPAGLAPCAPTVTLFMSGTDQEVLSTSVDLADGSFLLSGVKPGTYDVVAHVDGYIDRMLEGLEVTDQDVQLTAVQLRGGVVNDDIIVNIQDIGTVISSFGDTSDQLTGPCSRRDAFGRVVDINADGIVNIQDIGMTISNFGVVTPQPWS